VLSFGGRVKGRGGGREGESEGGREGREGREEGGVLAQVCPGAVLSLGGRAREGGKKGGRVSVCVLYFEVIFLCCWCLCVRAEQVHSLCA